MQPFFPVELLHAAAKVLGATELAKWWGAAHGISSLETSEVGTVGTGFCRTRRHSRDGYNFATPQHLERAMLHLGKPQQGVFPTTTISIHTNLFAIHLSVAPGIQFSLCVLNCGQARESSRLP